MDLYFWINIVWFGMMLLCTFYKNIAFYKELKYVLPAILFVAGGFMLWNIFFTVQFVWGFNVENLSGFSFFNVPIEEWMLFFIFPYTAIFVFFIFEKMEWEFITKRWSLIFATIITVIALILFVNYREHTYTFWVACLVMLLNGILYFGFRPKWYQCFWSAFLVFYFPFFFLNGWVSSYIASGPIVWYNPNHIIGIKILTIPVENIMYYFLMFLFTLVIYKSIKGCCKLKK